MMSNRTEKSKRVNLEEILSFTSHIQRVYSNVEKCKH